MSNPKIYFTAFDNGSVHLSAKRFADDSWEWEMNKVEITNNVVMNPGVTADDFSPNSAWSSARLVSSLSALKEQIMITKALIEQTVTEQEEAMTHILHVRASEVAFAIDAANPGLTQQQYDEMLKAADAIIFARRTAYYTACYA